MNGGGWDREKCVAVTKKQLKIKPTAVGSTYSQNGSRDSHRKWGKA